MASILKSHESAILGEWVKQQMADAGPRGQSHSETEAQSRSFLSIFTSAVQTSYDEQLEGEKWDDVRGALGTLSKNRAVAGYSPSQTATFVFSLKKPLFEALRRTFSDDAKRLNEETWLASNVIDKLGLVTVEAYQKGREQVINRQQQELLDLSTPVIKLWDGIVAVPLIGTLDSERTQVVMESLLDAIVDNEATVAIIDITGVPTVDTLVAQHLLKAVAAARLMGAECIISGIRPQIAQTIVHLGVDLGDVVTKATLADALRIALSRRELAVMALVRRAA
ncbi:STAS domain-containing protein [Caenimonas koreensis DSM 17982]|uniref:STAS domain-containing protein n=2 Tax=Caenimonas TaxID=763439 RepID=A0A844AYI7_9BURK|nr:STAS domain-containing protein [Caenimonas koreensis DSM 17982]